MAAKKTRNKKKTGKKAPLILRLAKWVFVTGLWGVIALSLLIAWYASELPDITRSTQFEQRSAITIKARDGDTLARYGELKGVSIDVSDVPPHLVYAVLAIEDRRFYQHFGVDPLGIARAMLRNLQHGRVSEGGSTITQQLAKNLFLSPERTIKRKAQEAVLALWLEYELSKDEILTAYLNRVYLGAGTYGVDAAARTYFDKGAADISLYEAAMLAGLLKAPSRFSPRSNPSLAAQRARTVLNAMADAGYITPEQAQAQSLKGQALLRKPMPRGTRLGLQAAGVSGGAGTG